MNTRFLETLVWLTRLRSFSRTAEKLNTTQPAVSNRINKLEELLGVKLYDRSARQFELTPAGRRIIRLAEQIVDLSGELREASISDEAIDAKLRVGVIEIVTMSWLPDLVDMVGESFPKAVLEIGTGTTGQLLQQLRQDEMDLVIIVGPVNEPHTLSIPICNVALEWLAAPGKYDCTREIDVVDLSRMPVVLNGPGSSGYDMLIEYFRGYGIHNVPSHDRKLVIDCIYSLGTAMQVVRTGLGIMALPVFLFDEDLREGRVACMPVRQHPPNFTITACCKEPVANRLIHRVIDMASAAAAACALRYDPSQFWLDQRANQRINFDDGAQ